jgi:hypothetical protein
MMADQPITVHGIGGKQLEATHMGYLEEFFRMYASTDAKPNVLSLKEVEDMYAVTYVLGEMFTVHLPTGDIELKRQGKLYVANFYSLLHPKAVLTTVQENEDLYTCTEVQRAKEAYEFLKCSGYPSPKEPYIYCRMGTCSGFLISVVRILFVPMTFMAYRWHMSGAR